MMFNKPNATVKQRNATSNGAYKTSGMGVVKGNPKKCLRCKRRIRRGEAWTKHTSPADPQYGRYSIIVHDRCKGAGR
jgi:hypothetical protein